MCFLFQGQDDDVVAMEDAIGQLKEDQNAIRGVFIAGKSMMVYRDADIKCKTFDVCSRHPDEKLCSDTSRMESKLNTKTQDEMMQFAVTALTTGHVGCLTKRKVTKGHRSVHPLSKRRLNTTRAISDTLHTRTDVDIVGDTHSRSKRLLPAADANVSIRLPNFSRLLSRLLSLRKYLPFLSVDLNAGGAV